MKKPLSVLAAWLMILLLGCASLSGCSASSAETTAATTTAAPVTEAPATAAPTAEAPTTEAPTTEAPTEAPADDPALYEEIFAEWNQDAPALQVLIDFVESVTDESSPDFIPVENRIAVFDMDGTIYSELNPTYLEYYILAWRVLADPDYEADEDLTALAEEIRTGGLTHTYAGDMALRHANGAAKAYAGMSLQEFAHYITTILLKEADGFTGMNYGEAFYLPMIEVIDYLQDNDFTVYLCSGSDRFICRTLLEGMVDIPYEHIIGMDVALEASGQGDTDSLDYTFTPGDQLLRTDRLLVKNLKTNKVTAIAREIGKQPVLSFGNTSGDTAMHLYTISDNPYRSAAFMLIADDDVRDYGRPEKADALRTQWESYGFHVISMKNDFRTIYGDDVKKTGSFRWMQELGSE